MNIDPIQDEYNPGDTITCAAEGNPEPTLKWVDQNNDTVVESGTLEINAAMEGRQTYSCLAQNEVRGDTISAMVTITFNVTSKFMYICFCDGVIQIAKLIEHLNEILCIRGIKGKTSPVIILTSNLREKLLYWQVAVRGWYLVYGKSRIGH